MEQAEFDRVPGLAGCRFPLFVDLRGKRAVVIGGGPVAVRRARVLLEFGAVVTLIAPACGEVPPGAEYLRRPYTPGDLQGAFLAVAATDDRQVNRQVGEEAGRAGIPVSVADRREESTFYFPAICRGGGLVAGVVSQQGEHQKTAAAARAIRRVLEEWE